MRGYVSFLRGVLAMVEDLIGGVSAKLLSEFEYPVYADEAVYQGLLEPCFFISFIEAAVSPLIGARSKLRVPLDIAYFPCVSGSYAEMWGIGTRLLSLLQVVELADGSFVRGRNLSFEISDGILHVYVLFALHLIRVEQSAVMEEQSHSSILY